MSSYNIFATVYDKMMDNIPYEYWEQYILQLLCKFNVKPYSHITELGCGTGKMTRLLSEDGFTMTGIDLSEEMLKVAFRNTPDSMYYVNMNAYMQSNNETREESPITYIYGDMRDFKLNEKQDAIISICDSMNYLLTNDDLTMAMQAARNNLKKNGILIFDLKTKYFFENVLDGYTDSDVIDNISYTWKNKYNSESHIHKYLLDFNITQDDGSIRNEKEVHEQRAYSGQDIKECALNADFRKAVAYDAFTFEKPKKNSERIYIILFQ